MFARALIVLLLVLNLGVAAWWALQPAPSPPRAAEQPSGVPRLQLLDEVPPHARPASTVAAPAPEPTATTTQAVVERCLAFGPFADASTLANARATLQPQVTQLRVREAQTVPTHGWRVWLPPLADRAAAQAAAAGIAAAGFQDYYIVPGGDEANSIALGRYGNEDAAQRRQAALQAAGFPVQAQALGATSIGNWLDVVTIMAFDAEITRSKIGAPQVRPLDCAKLR